MTFVFVAASLLSLAAISVDRLLTPQLHLRYQQLVTINRVFKALLMIWFAAAASSVLRSLDMSENVMTGFAVLVHVLVIVTCSYT